MMKAWLESEFERYLAARGRRMTREKKLIIATIGRPFDHQDLIDTLSVRNDRVSRPAIYRTITAMVEAGLVCNIATDEDEPRFIVLAPAEE